MNRRPEEIAISAFERGLIHLPRDPIVSNRASFTMHSSGPVHPIRTPPNGTDLGELLDECKDALGGFGRDHLERKEHIGRIELALSDHSASAHRVLLRRIREKFREHMIACPDLFEDDGSTALIREIEQTLATLKYPRYIYHGTILGRLSSIATIGLTPGHSVVWREPRLRNHILSAVFFEPDWRGAANWADTTSLRSRGPRGGCHRTAVVIRVNAEGLATQRDPAATRVTSLLIRSRVDVSAGSVFVAPLAGFPRWVPLVQLVKP